MTNYGYTYFGNLSNVSADYYDRAEGDGGPPAGMIQAIYGIFGFIFFIGVLGNLLVILVVSRKLQGMSKTMSVFITNLSVSDMLYLTFSMPFSATIFTMPSWIFGNFMCKFVFFSMYACMFASIYTLVVMSLDRYIAVVYPLGFINLRTVRNAIAATVIIWIISSAFSAPYLFVFKTETEDYITHTETYCFEYWKDERHRPRYHVFLFICGYALPLVAITGAYLRILCVLWRRIQLSEVSTPNNNSGKSKRKTSRLVCVVVLAFGVCWLPHHIINLWMGYGNFSFTMGTLIFKLFALCLASVNSCLNPIIYTIMSENFRKSVVKAIQYMFWKRQRGNIMSETRRDNSRRKMTGKSRLQSSIEKQEQGEKIQKPVHGNKPGSYAKCQYIAPPQLSHSSAV